MHMYTGMLEIDLIILLAGAIIGFQRTLYEVNENDGQAQISVILREGILRRPVLVSVQTSDGSAVGEKYLILNCILQQRSLINDCLCTIRWQRLL